MESDPSQGQQGLHSNNCAVPSSVDRSADSALASGDPSQQQFLPASGALPSVLPQGVFQQANPYLPAGVPQVPFTFGPPADLLVTQQQLPPGYVEPPGPPTDGEGIAASIPVTAPLSASARARPSSTRGRQASVSAAKQRSSASDPSSSPTRYFVRKKSRRTRRSRSRVRNRRRRPASTSAEASYSRAAKRKQRTGKRRRSVSRRRR